MKNFVLIFFLILAGYLPSFAKHIKGGEVFYEYRGTDAATNRDRFFITVRLLVDCSSTSDQIDDTIALGIYRNADNIEALGSPFSLPKISKSPYPPLRLTTPSPCIVNPSPVCFLVILYGLEVLLPKIPSGYTAIFQRCCRIDGLRNLNPSDSVGASYTCQIHGNENLLPGETNSSPQFLIKDTTLVCQNRRFSLNFGAFDPDGDSVSYQFCSAYLGGIPLPPTVPHPGPPTTLQEVTYAAGFSGGQPLGPDVTIDPRTGLINGLAPRGGDYVVCVCLTEWRRGKPLSTHRKDFIMRIDANCDFAAADLNSSYITCDGYSFTFGNEAPFSSLIHTYFWDFGLPGRTDDTSSKVKPTFVYPDTGSYTVKLYINKGEECSDSAVTTLKVYPGFFPAFNVNGSCKLNAFLFSDATTLRYGTVSKWKWNFGDETTAADSAITRNASWKYSTTGYKKVQFTVESSLGCSATITKDSVEVRDKPLITLPFRDTLICSVDTLQLAASGLGSFSWTAGSPIINSTSSNPLVFPKTTTFYHVSLNDNGCISNDSVRVRVVDFVSLSVADTTVCLTDSITLHPGSNGLRYQWETASPGILSYANTKNPLVVPVSTTTYHVTAFIGKCSAGKDLTVFGIPYPGSSAGNDTVICYGDKAQLHATIKGASFTWSPVSTLDNPSILFPVASPLRTTTYILSVNDVLGCPKPKRDTIVVTVRPPIIANAGRDTSVVAGQPLVLKASGADLFLWSPPTGLNRTDMASPTAILFSSVTYNVKVFTSEGCFSYDTIAVKVFTTNPDIFVPSAFTPGKASNNRFRPIPVGISVIEMFQVYNRWGQLLYSNNDTSNGWDGKFAGKAQEPGAYVWMVKGRDYTGKTVFKKGTFILLR